MAIERTAEDVAQLENDMKRIARTRAREICATIAADMASDAISFDGKSFNGRNVAEYFGNQGAAIAALANIVRELL